MILYCRGLTIKPRSLCGVSIVLKARTTGGNVGGFTDCGKGPFGGIPVGNDPGNGTPNWGYPVG